MDSMPDELSEAVSQFLHGKISRQDALKSLQAIQALEGFSESVLDNIWMWSFVESDEQKSRIHDLVSGLVEEELVSVADVIALLEGDAIPSSIQPTDTLRRKRTQAKTKRVYTIPKFNLLNECAEGYSVIVDVAWSSVKMGLSDSDASLVVDKLKKAIGHYQLCPNKVLSVLMSLMVNLPTGQGLDQLLKVVSAIFPAARITSVLVFHFLSFGKSEDSLVGPSDPGKADAKPGQTPPGLFTVISRLHAAGCVDVSELWSIMTPRAEEISAAAADLMASYSGQVEAVGKTLAGALASGEDDDSSPEQKLGLAVDEFSRKLGESQKILFLAEMISGNYFGLALPLMVILQQQLGGIPLGTIAVINEALSSHVRGLFPTTGDAMDSEERESQLLNWLPRVLPFLGTAIDPSVLAALFTWCKTRFESAGAESRLVIETLMATVLLPALSVQTPNPYLCSLAWDLLVSVPTSARFRVYQTWEGLYDQQFPLALVKASVTAKTRSLLKRVVKGAQIGDIASRTSHLQFAKLAACNPLIGLRYIVSTIQVHFNTNLIEPYVDVTARIPAVGEDVVVYLVSSALVAERPALNLKTATVEPWLANLADFTGRFFKRHSGAPLDGLMKLVSASMVSAQVMQATPARVMLEAVIEHMGDFTVVHQLNAEQIDSIAGGPVLLSLTQASNLASQDNAKSGEKAKLALRQALLGQQGLVGALWYSLASQLAELASGQQIAQELIKGGGLKLLGILYDGVHACLLQLTEFLGQSCSIDEYVSLLPKDASAVFKGPVDVGMGFHLLRPSRIAVAGVYAPTTNITDELFNTFWSLSLFDIVVPTDSYKKHSALLSDRVVAQESAIEKMERAGEAKEVVRAGKRELARLKDIAQKLKAEMNRQAVNFEHVKTHLANRVGFWWTGGVGNKASTSELISAMIAKRVTLSVQDALFCAHFVKFLAKQKVAGFQFLDFFNQWTDLLPQMTSCCSEGEMKNLAEFMKDLMQFVVDLRKNGQLFASFVTADNPAFNRNYFAPDKGQITPITEHELRKGHAKWENQVTKALTAGMKKESSDWCEKRNCLILISKTCETFPLIQANALELIKAVQELTSDPQEDIAMLSLSLSRKLASLEANWMDRTSVPAAAAVSTPPVVEKHEEPMEDISDAGDKSRRMITRRKEETRKPEVVKRDESPRRSAKRPLRDEPDHASKGPRSAERNERERSTRSRVPDPAPIPRARDRATNSRR